MVKAASQKMSNKRAGRTTGRKANRIAVPPEKSTAASDGRSQSSKQAERVAIPEIDMELVQIPIRGIDGPLVVHNWSEKAIRDMLAKQMQIRVVAKQAKSPEEEYKASLYVAEDGSYGFPACAFKAAMVRAAKDLEGWDMITMRQLVFVVPDCRENRTITIPTPNGQKPLMHEVKTDLVRLIGTPRMRMDLVRLQKQTADIRFRGEFDKWEAVLTIRYRAGRIRAQEIANLVNLAGTVGIGEGRPEKSADMGWGRFEVDTGSTRNRRSKR